MTLRSLKWIFLGVTLTCLAIISWPKFELFRCRSIQSEAKAQLNHLYEAEKFYFAHHHSYTSLEMLIQEGLIKSNEENYAYKTTHSGDKNFGIVATAKNLRQDTWAIDQTGNIQSITNACTL